MADYVAMISGAVESEDCWSPYGVPGPGDNCDLNGNDMTTAGSWSVASITDLVTGGGTLTLGTGTLTCPYVDEVEIIVPSGVTATIAFGTAAVGSAGCWYSGSGQAIECQNGGTVTNVTGDLTNSGSGYGAFNNGGTWTDFSGNLHHSGPVYGAYNAIGGWIDFSGNVYNTGSGSGVSNASGTGWYDFTGDIWLGSTAGLAFAAGAAYAIPFSGDIKISPQADLSAANIKSGKTILTVAGTMVADILGAGMI